MNTPAFTRFAVIFNGVLTVLTALLSLFASEFFYNTVADYAPFNRHFLGDIGAFSMALGVGLLLAARDPYKHPLIIGAAALGNLLHVLNHAYDDLFVERLTTQHWLTNTIPLLVATVMLVIAYWNVSRASQRNTK
jgi:predicted anti-sigma-YlaC factor YlaD